jgi:hypothetical protein
MGQATGIDPVRESDDVAVWLDGVSVLPDDFDVMPPGPRLAAVVASVDRSVLDASDLLRVARARRRLVAHQEAQLLADLHRVARVVPDHGRQAGRREPGRYPWAETEAAFALRWSHGRAADQLVFADEVIDRLPQVFDALDAGELDVPKARAICDAVVDLGDDIARGVVDKVVDKAREQTTAELRARLRRLVLAADPGRAENRARREITQRRVQAFVNDNNLATLAGYELAPHRVAAVIERLDAIAKAAKSAGDARRVDQIRADAFLDLLVGEGIAVGEPISDGGLPGTDTATATATASVQAATAAALPGPRRGVIDLQVPLTTLMGLTRLPGEVAGWGPVISEIATQVAREQTDATWRYSVYNSFGELAHHGIVRRRPAAVDEAFVKARDRTCRAPGCRRGARGCDVDHTVDWQHSHDSRRCNLACLCKRHHRFKHEAGAQLVQLSPGVLMWQTPLGPQYVTFPDRYLNQLDLPGPTTTPA